jgi:hypothetical protein
MVINDIIAIIISIFALLISSYSYRRSTSIANANLELNIYNMIRNSKSNLHEISKQLMFLENDDKKKLEYADKIYASLVEDLITSYEGACTKYLDNKVDRKRFEKNLKHDIQKIVEDEDINKIVDFNKQHTRREYGAILKVYSKWFDKEP